MIESIQIKTKLIGNPIKQPHFKASVKTAKNADFIVSDPRAIRSLIALMDMYAVLGGAASHYGGPAALADIWSVLHAIVYAEAQDQQKPWHELFHLVNDAGHCENALYAIKANYEAAGLNLESLKKFREINSGLTGHGEVHCFPEGVFISNGPLGSGLPQAQGLAFADGLSAKLRTTITTISDGACMEGEAKESFAAIPGLAASGKLAPFIMIISDNNTKLSGRIDKDSFSMEPTFNSLKSLGWKVIQLDAGHDLQKCYESITEAINMVRANPKVPVAIHGKTIKGMGTKKTMDSASGGHGFPLKSPTELAAFISEIYSGEQYPELFDLWIKELLIIEGEIKAKAIKDSGEKIQKGVASALIQARKEGLPIVSVTADLAGSTGVADFRKEFPEGSLDVGVAESNMISTAIGLSKSGYIPVVDTFAQFGVTKGALPLIMSSLSEGPMIAIFSHTGFQDAADGASHQSLSYIAMTASIPNCDIYCLSCSEEAYALVYQAVKEFADSRKNNRCPNSSIFFLGRENFPKNYIEKANYKLKEAQIVFDNADRFNHAVCVVTAGSMLPQALEAAKILEQKSVGVVVVNSSSINHVDVPAIKSALQKTKGQLITVDDHQVMGGLGQLVCHALLLSGVSFKVKSLGVKQKFGRSSYTAQDLYHLHEIDALAIVKAALA